MLDTTNPQNQLNKGYLNDGHNMHTTQHTACTITINDMGVVVYTPLVCVAVACVCVVVCVGRECVAIVAFFVICGYFSYIIAYPNFRGGGKKIIDPFSTLNKKFF